MTKPFVAVLVGSGSDLPVMRSTFQVLEKLNIPWEAKITSAHRAPEATRDYVQDAEQRGCAIFIAAAGLAAHLAGAVASRNRVQSGSARPSMFCVCPFITAL